MSERADFQEGRRVRVADLNREAAARTADLDTHVDLAHPGTGLTGADVVAPDDATAAVLIPDEPGRSVRLATPGAADTVVLAPAGHRIAGTVTSTAPVGVTGVLRLTQAGPPPDEATPWTIRPVEIRDDDHRLVARELRVELAAPEGASLSDNRITVRFGDGPVLEVDAGGDVTMAGDLQVAGTVSEGPIPADPTDPRFAAAITDTVAERILAIADRSGTSGLGLSAEATAGSAAAVTPISAKVHPDRQINNWGAAIDARHGGHQNRLLVHIGRVTPSAETTFLTDFPVVWEPPLTAGEPAAIRVAVVAFDFRGELMAQQVTVPVEGPAEEEEPA